MSATEGDRRIEVATENDSSSDDPLGQPSSRVRVPREAKPQRWRP